MSVCLSVDDVNREVKWLTGFNGHFAIGKREATPKKRMDEVVIVYTVWKNEEWGNGKWCESYKMYKGKWQMKTKRNEVKKRCENGFKQRSMWWCAIVIRAESATTCQSWKCNCLGREGTVCFCFAYFESNSKVQDKKKKRLVFDESNVTVCEYSLVR